LISFSKNADQEFDGLVKFLISKPSKILEETHMIRILVPLFGVLSKDRVIDMFNVMKGNIWSVINHKFGIYLIQKIFERDIDHSSEFLRM
jgi:hypothetical protein